MPGRWQVWLIAACVLSGGPWVVSWAQTAGSMGASDKAREVAPTDWTRILTERLPEIGDARLGRWPLVLWNGPDARTLDVGDITALVRRGVAPTIGLDADYRDAAKRLAAAGAPVIYLEGRGGRWPYDVDESAAIDPGLLTGWRRASEDFRAELLALRYAGVRLDAAWLDYENAPLNLRLEDVSRTRSTVPARVAGDEERFRIYRRQLWQSLVSTYFAAPLREVFPQLAVSNWIVSASRSDFPVLDWLNRPHPRTDIGLYTATNPVAYGIDTAFHANRPRAPMLSAAQIDRIYTHILLRQVSADSHARRLDAPHLDSMVWVSRRVRDEPQRETPEMSRAAYREALRHIWLRGIDGMLVFNPLRAGHEPESVWEVEDAAAIYREMLADAEMLEGSEVMNFAVPDAHREAVFWSGLRTDSRLLLRTTNPGIEPVTLRISGWSGRYITLEAPPGSATHRLHRSP